MVGLGDYVLRVCVRYVCAFVCWVCVCLVIVPHGLVSALFGHPICVYSKITKSEKTKCKTNVAYVFTRTHTPTHTHREQKRCYRLYNIHSAFIMYAIEGGSNIKDLRWWNGALLSLMMLVETTMIIERHTSTHTHMRVNPTNSKRLGHGYNEMVHQWPQKCVYTFVLQKRII